MSDSGNGKAWIRVCSLERIPIDYEHAVNSSPVVDLTERPAVEEDRHRATALCRSYKADL